MFPAGITNIYIIFIHCLVNIHSVCMSVWSLALIGFYCIKNQWRNVLFLLKTYTLKIILKLFLEKFYETRRLMRCFRQRMAPQSHLLKFNRMHWSCLWDCLWRWVTLCSSRGNTRRLEVFLGSLYIYIYSLYIQTVYTF